jgi:pimeloyl-ACP methyl ester carboxylesterase
MSVAAAAETSALKTSEAVISYRDVGTGPVLLVLHGGGPGATGWGNFGLNVDDFKDRYRVIVPDQPGFGGSHFTNDSGGDYHTVSAKAMAELLQALKIKKAHVLGNSMGGGVALRMALHSPDVVDRLVLMGPYFRGLARPLMGPAPQGNALLTGYFPTPTLEKMRHLIRTFVFNPDTIDGVENIIKARYEATLRPEIAAGFVRMSRQVPDPDPRSPFEKVASITNKALLLWGRDDKFCHLEDAFTFLAALRNSELVVFRDTGHWVQVERRAEFASYVAAFLSR